VSDEDGRGEFYSQVLLNGNPVANQVNSLVAGASAETITLPFIWDTTSSTSPIGNLFEPGTATSNTLTVQVEGSCGAGGGIGLAAFKVNSVSIDVVGVH